MEYRAKQGAVHSPDDKRGFETIAARAHELWVSCGEPVVQDDAIWQEAERELKMERTCRAQRRVFWRP